jgi:hypothetical protein
MMRRILIMGGILLWAGVGSAQVRAGLVNPGFEYGQVPGSFADYTDVSGGGNPAFGWNTTAPDHQIEVWGTGFLGVPAFQGQNFVELNANSISTLYQDVTGIPAGASIDFHFAHRGRQGVDTMSLTITDQVTNAVLFSQAYSDGNQAWGFYTNPAPIIATGHTLRFAYDSISAAGGNPTVGNFLDDANFGVGVNAVPEPSSIVLMGLAGFAGLVARTRSALRRRGR